MNPNRIYKDQNDPQKGPFDQEQTGHSEQVIRLLIYLRKWAKLLIVAVIVGLSIGAYNVSQYEPVYHTYLVATSRYLSNDQVHAIVQGLQQFISDGDVAILSDKLKVNEEQAGKIKSLRCDFLSNGEDGNVFKLQMDIASGENYALYEAGIFSYLENLEYVHNKIKSEVQFNKAILEDVRVVQGKMDSIEWLIRETVNAPQSDQNLKSLNEAIMGLAGIVSRKLELREKQLEISDKVNINKNFEVIQGFENFSKPSEANISNAFLAPFMLALLAWGLVTWLLEMKEEIKRRTRLKIK